MNTNRLAYFTTVYELGSMTAAAKKHYISQVAMSQQIKTLEEELDVQLFLREKKKLVPTSAAHYLYSQARPLLYSYDRLMQYMKSYKSDNKKLLSIGINYFSLYEQMKPYIQRLTELYSNIEVAYEFGPSNDLITRLDKGSLDCIIIWDSYIENFGFETWPAFTSESAVLIPERSSLYHVDHFDYSMLSDQQVVILVEELPYFRRTGKLSSLVSSIERNTSVQPGNLTITDSIDRALLMSSENGAIIFTYDDKLYKIAQDHLRPIIIRDSFMKFRYVFAWRGEAVSSALEAFVNFIKDPPMDMK